MDVCWIERAMLLLMPYAWSVVARQGRTIDSACRSTARSQLLLTSNDGNSALEHRRRFVLASSAPLSSSSELCR